MRKIILTLFYCPLLVLLSQTVAGQEKDVPIEIRSFSIDIRADMFVATTVMNIEFYNPNAKVLDGEYNFALKDGQVITGFALDINGFMRQGVITDKQKGRVAYENTIRRRIDPGLLEMTAGNNYRVRVYPMPAKGTRKIRIILAEQLSIRENTLHYNLPLDVPYAVKQFEVFISAMNVQQMPVPGAGLLEKILFQKGADTFFLHYVDRNALLKKPLSFSIELPAVNQIVCAKKINNTVSFALHLKPDIPAKAAVTYSSGTVFWDVSGSASKRNIKKDLEFLENFIAEKGITDLTIVLFSNTIHESKTFHGKAIMNVVRKYLQAQTFDGGTQLGSVDCDQFKADVFLLFSDGLSNFRNDKLKTNSKPVHCISSSPAANHSGLKTIAERTGGRYVDLYATEVSKAVKEFNIVQHKLLTVQAGDKNNFLNTQLPVSFDHWVTVTGQLIAETSNPLSFSFGDEGRVMKTESIHIGETGICDSASPATLNLLQQYQQLLKEADGQKIALFAAKNKLVSASTSFIVLDNLQDYIQYGIEPPADLQEEYNKMIYVIKQQEQQRKVEGENAVVNNLKKAVNLYNERINWWNKEEKPISLKIAEKNSAVVITGTDAITEIVNNQSNNLEEGNLNPGNASLQEVVVTAYGVQRRRDITGSITTIRGAEISSGYLNIQQALAGRVAGVMIVENNGSPGAVPKIFIRGARSLSANSEPLYVVDGLSVDGSWVSAIPIDDIESVTVLKDIQANVLYGSRAASGAIVITTKRGFRNTNQYKESVAKYKDLEDVEYVMELKNADKEEMYGRYLQMKDSLGKEPAFCFDAAQLLFESGDKEKALRILSNLAELENENHQLLRAMGYMLETWMMYEEAIDVYKKVVQIKEEEPQSYRDLALAYDKKGEHQQAVDILYEALTKNWLQYEDRYRGLKSLLLNEMNAIIHLHRSSLDLSKINADIIKPLPVDIRIVIDWNKDETDIDLHIVEPGGEECFYSHKLTQSGGRLSEDFTQGYGPEEYQVKVAKKGKYAIRVNYYGDRYQKQQVPSFIKLTVYKNFGKPNQSVSIQNLIMENQQGIIEIGEVKW